MFWSIFLANTAGIAYIAYKERVFAYIRLSGFSVPVLKNMLAYSLPLIPNYLCWWILGASDKSIVNAFLGLTANGLLAVAQKFSTAYTTVYSVFNLTWTEHASIHMNDQDKEEYYSSVLEKAFRLLSCACIGMIAMIGPCFSFLVDEKFADAYNQVPIYMSSAFLYAVIGIFSVVYIAYKRTDKIANTSVGAAIINLCVHFGLIRFVGLYAASISSVAAYAVLLGIRYFDIQKFVKIQTNKKLVFSVAMVLVLQFVLVDSPSLISLIFIYISYLIYKYGHFLSFMQFLMHFIFARMHLRKFLLPLYDFLRETCYKL